MPPVDLRKLRPSELARLLNSTPLGEVIGERQLRRHRNRAGYRVGDGNQVDLLRYIAWCFDSRHEPKEDDPSDDYDAMKESARARNAALSKAGRDIGELPAVVNPERKAAARMDFQLFCESYFAQTFHMAWSPDHIKVIKKIENATLHGGLYAMAMPRGSGKTSLAECACLWAMLYGHRDFVCLIGSSEAHALDMLDSIKTELDGNDVLLEDFPEVCFPIARLEGIAHRANGQLYQGERTHIGWEAREIILPTIPGSDASGAIVRVAGITGRIRGMKFKRPDGRTVRPSLVVLDDPQTDESASSPSQCATRESILAGAVLGLAGPGKKISGIMPCTVIRPDDMADRILDRDKHPQWQGERTKMVYLFPKNEKLWEQYEKILSESLRADMGISQATEFYLAHREAMDEGAKIAWPERFNHDEVSAIQHAMNLKFQDEAAFWAEYQNEPMPDDDLFLDMLTPDQIIAKVNAYPRGRIPSSATHLTAFIDVQQKLLFYAVVAWGDDFSGYVVDYGEYPDQKRPYFTLRDAKLSMALYAKGAGLEGSIYAGLEKLTEQLLGREWMTDSKVQMKVERCLIDANWGQSTDVVYQFCRQSTHAAVLMPSHGRFVGASSRPLSEYSKKPGDRAGLNWRVPSIVGRRSVRHVIYDTNFWKSFVHARLAVSMGDKGCISLFGKKPSAHRLFSEHLCAEYRVQTEGRGRTVGEWKIRPEHFDNHWFDCLVGCAVAASMQGVALEGISGGAPVKRERVNFSEMQRKRRNERQTTNR